MSASISGALAGHHGCLYEGAVPPVVSPGDRQAVLVVLAQVEVAAEPGLDAGVRPHGLDEATSASATYSLEVFKNGVSGCVCMCVCMFMYVCMYICVSFVCASMCVYYVYLCMYVYICMYVRACVYICVLCVYMYSMCVYKYVYVYVCMCALLLCVCVVVVK